MKQKLKPCSAPLTAVQEQSSSFLSTSLITAVPNCLLVL